MVSTDPIRVAVASTDGKVVNQHFGRAAFFSIVELGAEGWRYVERRETSPPCRGFDHDDGDMARAVAGLWDCAAVLVSRAGGGARRALEISGISVFEIGLPVHDALRSLQQYYFGQGKYEKRKRA